MEDEVDRLGGGAVLLLDVLLRVVEDRRCELDIARFVDPVHVAERGRDGETIADLGDPLVCVGHFLGLGVEVLRLDVGVVHAVFFAARDAELDLERHAHLRHALEIGDAEVDVLLHRFLGEVEHVGAEQRLAGGGVVLLAGVEQSVDPCQ